MTSGTLRVKMSFKRLPLAFSELSASYPMTANGCLIFHTSSTEQDCEM